MREFQNATSRNAGWGKRAVSLDWVERGPGNVGGRSRWVVIDPSDPSANTWYVASVGGGVWKARRSDILGQERVEWTPLTDDLPAIAATALDISRSNPDIMYVGTGEGFGNIDYAGGLGVFKTTDGGESWIHLESTSAANDADWRFVNRLVVHPDNPDIVVVVTNKGIFRTKDGGQSFEKVYARNRPVQDLDVHPDNFDIQFATVNGTAILRSTDGGETWQESLSWFRYGARRIELAISQSHPEVIWASVQGTWGRIVDGTWNRWGITERESPVSDLYRSTDGGNSWHFLDRRPDELSSFLGAQGWYDNTILVHPFSPDTAYVGGIELFRVVFDGETSTINFEGLGSFVNYTDFLNFFLFDDNTSAEPRVFLGYELVGGRSDVQDLGIGDMTSVEVRFGPGLTQMAHRYTVPPNGGTNRDGGPGVHLPEYIYQDYVEVPFQVWDTDNDRQLMVSFRDQQMDGDWTLLPNKIDGHGITHSREYILISKYDYDASAPKPELAENGGLRKGMMYFFWPYLNEEFPLSDWDPNDPAPGFLRISFARGDLMQGKYTIEPLESTVDVHVDHHALIALPIDKASNEFYLFNANDGGMAWSRNSGKSWVEGDVSSGFNTSQFYDAVKSPGFDMYLGGTQDNGTWISPNNPHSGRKWTDVGGADGYDAVWKGADSLMQSSQFNNIYRSLDGGNSWEQAGNVRTWSGQFLTSIAWTPKSGNAVFTISPTAGPIRSLDFGESWHTIVFDWQPDEDLEGGKVRVSLADPSVLWAGYRLKLPRPDSPGLLQVSENALRPRRGIGIQDPVAMRAVNEPEFAPASIFSGLATHPFSRSTAYVMFSVSCKPKLLRTEDMGKTWKDLSGFGDSDNHTENCKSTNGFPNSRVFDLAVFPDIPWVLWVGTDLGIFESRDHGETWSYVDNGLPAVSVWRIRIIDGQVVVATHGRGIWTLDITQVQTASEQQIDKLPNFFELEGNYPNPFNPTTSITFRVGNDSHIRVNVFDMLGRKVATLTDQPYTRGTHQIQWDASGVASGQYIYRLEADGKIINAKSMILAK